MDNIDNYLKLIIYRNKIIEYYYAIYKDYKVLPPLNLDSNKDITLDFINCTICVAKEHIINNTKGENYIISQPCLRNNHIDILQDINKTTNYMGYFTMLGGFCYINESDNWIEKFNNIVLKQFKFFRILYPNNYIKLTIPNQYKNFIKLTEKTKSILINNNCEIVYSNTDEKNLKWKYGIENIHGYGTRWEILSSKNKLVNCGNDIILYKNEKAIGIDFGSGLETLVSVKNGEEHLLYSNIVCSDLIKSFCKENSNNEKIIDSLTSLLCIDYYKEYHSFRIKYLRYMYIKNISSICIINEISNQSLVTYINEICKNIGINTNYLIINEIEEHKKYLHSLCSLEYIENLIELYSKNNYKIRGYKKNITSIEIEALKTIIRREQQNDKTRKIKKRR